MKIVSACLAGINCNYKGESKPNKKVIELVKKGEAIPICPEQLGGLPTPRIPQEIQGFSGEKVLDGECKVLNKNGEDVTQEFIKGAHETLRIVKIYNCKEAILKARSPSCGYGKTPDGTFSGKLINGNGVTAALLKRNGIKVYTEEDL